MTAYEAIQKMVNRLENVRLPVGEVQATDEIRNVIGGMYALLDAFDRGQPQEPEKDETVSEEPVPEEVDEDVHS